MTGSSTEPDDGDKPLDTHMEGHQGTPEAVAKVLDSAAGLMKEMPEDMQVSFELDVWEETEK